MNTRPTLRRLGRASVLGSAAALLALGGCDSGSSSGSGDEPIDIGQIQLQLTRAQSCDDLLAKVQAGVIVQLEQLAKQLRAGEGGDYYYGDTLGGGPGFVVEESGMVAAGRDPVAQPDVAPSAGDADSVDQGAGNPGAGDGNGTASEGEVVQNVPREANGNFSGTTVQVQDVDEADIVKTDGNFMYLLHGGTLFVLEAWPADATQIVASTLVEGEPTEMFVRDGRAVVFSNVWGDLRASGEELDDSYYYYSPGYTKLTVLDVSGDEPSVLRESYVEGNYVSSRRHDGRVRAVVQEGFKVPRLGYPDIQYRDPFGDPFPQADVDAQVDAWLSRTRRSIANSEIGDWLPREFEMNGDTLATVPPRCGDYYAPDPGLTDQGVTSVVSLDMDDPTAALGGATILGRAERVYANTSALLITQTDYRGRYTGESFQRTVIHRFDLAGAETAYAASGEVDGYVHDQFSLDERNGVIRVSTTEEIFGNSFPVSVEGVNQPGGMPGIATPSVMPTPPDVDDDPAIDNTEPAPAAPVEPEAEPEPDNAGTDDASSDEEPTAFAAPVDKQNVEGPRNRVITLATDGRDLVELGSTEAFGLTERIYATRFMGDRAYVVTFRQTDPLFILDMSDDADPRIVGELQIPGFSNYLYPLDGDHLFAIGQDATAEGRVQGLALQIFDVSDAASPALAHRYVYDDFGFSPANVDHRAISFHRDGGVVAFPFRNYSTGENTLEVFSVSAEAGIERLGGMGNAREITLEECLAGWGWDPESIAQEVELAAQEPEFESELLWECRQSESFRRGLFRDDVVYGISTGGVYAYDLAALDGGPLSEVSLPGQVWDYRNYGGGVDQGVEGVNPVGTPARPPTMGTGGAASSGSAPASAGSAEAEAPVDDVAAEQDPAADDEPAPDPNEPDPNP